VTESTTHVSKRDKQGQWQAFLSQDVETRTAVVFVHGFHGHFLNTWANFHSVIDEENSERELWQRTDLFFWGYESVNEHISASASELKHFLGSIYPCPLADYFNEDLTSMDLREAGTEAQRAFVRPGPYHYERLKLVGHSEGAVIIRRLLADVTQEQPNVSESSLHRESPYLFAPAHLGFNPSGKWGVLFNLTGIGFLILKLAEQMRSYQHLKPGSASLTKLKSDTETLSLMYPELQCLRASIFWGKKEDVVVAERFACDLASQEHWELGKDHIDVCKPGRDYLTPLKFVREAMADAAKRPVF
jgi:hypothetical protein